MMMMNSAHLPLFLEILAKTTLLLLLLTLVARRLRTAAAQHLALCLGIAGALVVPPLLLVGPGWRLPVAKVVQSAAERPAGLLSRTLAAAGVRDGLLAPRSQGAPPAGGVSARTASVAEPLPRGLALLWGLGVLGLLLRFAAALHGARRLVRRARPAEDAGLLALTQELSAEVGLRRAPRLRLGAVPVPVTTGILRPVVLLPADAAGWSRARQRLSLLHELAHVRRRDCLTQALAEVACALQWFQPLLWRAARQLRELREVAADDLVLRSGARGSAYAQHLLSYAALLWPAPRALSALGSSSGGLTKRVQAILAPRGPEALEGPLPRRVVLPLGFAAALLTLLLSGVKVQAGPSTYSVAGATESLRTGPAPAAPHKSAPTAGTLVPGSASAVLSGLVEAQLRQSAVLAAGERAELTLEPRLQGLAEEELATLFTSHRPSSASIVVIDPKSGELRALASRAQRGAAVPAVPAVQATYLTGSTMKSLLVALALEAGTLRPQQTFFCENGRWTLPGGGRDAVLSDVGAHGDLSVAQILAVSSNIGAAKIYQPLGRANLARGLARFHLGQAPALPLPQVAAGSKIDAAAWSETQAVGIAVGEGLLASPLQVAAAYAALANDGVYHEPVLVRAVVGAGGARRALAVAPPQEVVKPAAARTVLGWLEEAINGPQGTGRRAAIAGARVAGKTGTANRVDAAGRVLAGRGYYSSFAGVLPLQGGARLVVLIGVDDAAPATAGESATGGSVAAPSFQRLGARIRAAATP